MRKSMKRNILRRGAAIAMAVLLVVPALPVGAADAGAASSVAGQEDVTSGESGGLGVEVYGNGGTGSPDSEVYGNDGTGSPDAEVYGSDGTERSVSDNNAVMTAMEPAGARAAASTGTIGSPDGAGHVLEWSYDDSTQTLTITGSGVLSGSNTLLGAAPLDSMEIRKIKFQDCKVTGSMAEAFCGRSDLEEIDLSGLDTSGVTDMSSMFLECRSLSSLDVSNFETGNVTNMGGMFKECWSLESLDLSIFDTGNVTNMGYMFSGCRSLESLDLSSFDTGNATYMWYMFSSCGSIESLDLSIFDTGNVTNMSRMFDGCRSLESLDLSSFDTGNVTDMSRMFDDCRSLESLDVSGFNTGNVTDMYAMFGGCWSLSNLDVSNFDTGNVTDMSWMFYSCSSLESLDLSSFGTGNVTSMRSMFCDCSSLGSLDLSSFATGNVTTMESMFWKCSSLRSLDLSSFATGNVTTMESMFDYCSSLGSLDLSSFDTGNVIGMGRMFGACSSLGSLDLSSFDTGNVTQMWHMFDGCSSLESLDLSSFDTGSVIDMSRMFYNCTNLSTLQTPRNVGLSVPLPTVSTAVWHLPDGTEVTELPQNLSTSILLTRTPVIITTTEELNMPDVIRVKYVPYSYTVETDNTDPDNQVTFSVVEGRLAEGLQMYPATGEIYGVPLEAGEFKVTVQASYSNPKYPASYAELTLIVLENTDDNVDTATDSGYEITLPVPDLNTASLSGDGSQLLVSEGEYAEFQDAVYLDGRRLLGGTEYTSEAGSTRITIRNQTLADAGAGSHTLSLEFRTQDTGVLRRAAQNLVISGEGGSGDADSDGSDGSDGDDADNGGSDGDNADNGGEAGNGRQGNAAASGAVTVIDYIVQPGDNLWKIAVKFYGDGIFWRQIFTDNADVIRHPDSLHAGQRLKIYLTVGNGMTGAAAFNGSLSASGSSYVVQPGDSLWGIAGKVYGKSARWREIYEANRNTISDPERIYTKQVLVIPEKF